MLMHIADCCCCCCMRCIHVFCTTCILCRLPGRVLARNPTDITWWSCSMVHTRFACSNMQCREIPLFAYFFSVSFWTSHAPLCAAWCTLTMRWTQVSALPSTQYNNCIYMNCESYLLYANLSQHPFDSIRTIRLTLLIHIRNLYGSMVSRLVYECVYVCVSSLA